MDLEIKKPEVIAPKPTRRLPSVDGLRALSITMVLAAHSTGLDGFAENRWIRDVFPDLLFNGNLGVRFFFVISGFLITYLLIQERDRTGSICLKSFYIRRSLRILPVYLAYLLLVAILQVSTAMHQGLITWIGCFTFTVNFLPRGVMAGHLWSIAVEEQFYLIWPIVFVWLSKRREYTKWVLSIPIVVAFICNAISYNHWAPEVLSPLFNHYSSLANFDSLAVGCIAAFFLHQYQNDGRSFLEGKTIWVAIAVGLLLIALPANSWSFAMSFFAVTGRLSQAVGFGIILLAGILHPRIFLPLNWRVVSGLGVISYSVYIWQQPFFAGPKTYGIGATWWMSFPWWLLVVIVVGTISYYGFERPLLKLRARFRRE